MKAGLREDGFPLFLKKILKKSLAKRKDLVKIFHNPVAKITHNPVAKITHNPVSPHQSLRFA